MLRGATIVAGVVFVMALVGILSRPLGALAPVWPANAVLVGLLVRRPRLATPLAWLAAFVAYAAADLVTGSEPGLALLLAVANVVGVTVAYLSFRRLPAKHRRLEEPRSLAYLFLVSGAAALAASLVGSLAGPVYLAAPWHRMVRLWFVAEFVNYTVLLSVVLTAPTVRPGAWRERRASEAPGMARWYPLLAVVAATVLGMLLDGYGAIAVPVPALLWCAIRYRFFPTALVTAGYSMAMLTLLSQRASEGGTSIASLALGLLAVVGAPLTLNLVQRQNAELMQRLSRAVNHDALTGVLSRRALGQRFQEALARCRAEGASAAALVLDLDRFKTVNDRYGHAVGDEVLVRFARAVSEPLRSEDLLGRLGGEEFVALLPGLEHEEAVAVAERIRGTVERLRMPIDGHEVACTVSIGVATATADGLPEDWRELVQAADQAMYEAKESGRNRVASVALRPAAPSPSELDTV